MTITSTTPPRAQVFSNCLKSSGRTGVIASEEEDVPVAVEESYSGNYIVVFDPLDGSSNIDAAVSTGSIFGIYAPNDECLADVENSGTVRANPGSPPLFFFKATDEIMPGMY